jgi:hypothetical protein
MDGGKFFFFFPSQIVIDKENNYTTTVENKKKVLFSLESSFHLFVLTPWRVVAVGVVSLLIFILGITAAGPEWKKAGKRRKEEKLKRKRGAVVV